MKEGKETRKERRKERRKVKVVGQKLIQPFTPVNQVKRRKMKLIPLVPMDKRKQKEYM